MCMTSLPLCMSKHRDGIWWLWRSENGFTFPVFGIRWSSIIVQVLGIECESPGRAVSALYYWDICPAPNYYYLLLLSNYLDPQIILPENL